MKTKDNKFDSLFRDRLDGYEIGPSAEADEMMGRLIAGRHNKRLYVRMAIAAGIILLMTSGIVLRGYWMNIRQERPGRPVTLSDNELNAMSENNDIVAVEKPAAPAMKVEAGDPVKSENIKNASTAVVETIHPSVTQTEPAGNDESARPKPVEIMDSKFHAVALSENLNNTITNPPELKETTTVVKQMPVVIEYIADNSRPKNNKSQLVDGIVSKAKEIGKDVNLGEIRDLKDQLFALDFIKPKKNSNNIGK